MTEHSHAPDLLPPRLSMDEYVEFLTVAFREHDPRFVRRQKEFEERIRKPFCLSERQAIS